jgi:DNA-directed RNA polymerase specialized sigma24 family protein
MQDDIPFEAGTERRIDAVRALLRCEEVLSKTQRPAHQRIFHLRYRESDSIRQIARRVGKSDVAVKLSLHRIRRALLDRIPELGQFLDTPSEAAA